MQVLKDNIYNLLSSSTAYTIPRYQRQYSWLQSPQCEMLWSDVKAIIEQNSIALYEQTNHFLGTIVTVKLQSMKGGFANQGRLQLIDGQQRVTSISLMIIALRYYIHEQWSHNHDSNLKSIEDKLTGLLTLKSGKPKLELGSADNDVYISLLNNSEQIGLNEDSIDDSLLLKNCRYFYVQWAALFEDNDRHLALTEQSIKPMFECLQFAHINLEPKNNDNPQQVFESLNSTGIDLSQTDLIRNFLLMEMNVEHQRELYQNYWRKIEGNIEKSVIGDQDPSECMTQFFSHFITAQNAEIPNKDAIYVKFKEWFYRVYDNENNANQKCLSELYDANKVWCDMYWSKGNDCTSNINRICFELHQLGRGVLNPVIFRLLYDNKCNKSFSISDQTLWWCLCFLRSYSIRLFIQNEDIGNLMNKSFCSLIGKLRRANDDESYLRSFINHLCHNNSESKTRCPTDAEFKNLLLNHSFDGSAQEKQYVRTMLFVVERFKNNEFELLDEQCSLDFILPDDLSLLAEKQGWSVELTQLSGHQEWCGRLGNLTLHEGRSLSKNKKKWGSFAQRKAELGKHYKCHLNQELRDENKLTWTVQDIKERGERLADLILKVLPYPDMSLVK